MKQLNIPLNKGAALAPMAGCTDQPLRRMAMEMGAIFCVSEMISAKALSLGDRKTEKLMAYTEPERPFGIQIFGHEPDVMAEGARYISRELKPDFIDINMGCPAPKITGSGAGSALMKTPELAGEIARQVVAASEVPVTVKFRAGWQENTAVDFARIMEDAGVALMTVHGRTRDRMYQPPVDLDIIKDVKAAVSVPVIGNGDIYSAEDALHMLRYTGCDGVMVGRGALGDPFVFKAIAAAMQGLEPPAPPTMEQRMAMLRRQVKELRELKGDYIAFCEARKHAAWYIKGIRGAAKLRAMTGGISSGDDLERFIDAVLAAAAAE